MKIILKLFVIIMWFMISGNDHFRTPIFTFTKKLLKSRWRGIHWARHTLFFRRRYRLLVIKETDHLELMCMLQWKRKSYATKLNLVMYIFEVVCTSISIYCFIKFPLRYMNFYQLVCRFRLFRLDWLLLYSWPGQGGLLSLNVFGYSY